MEPIWQFSRHTVLPWITAASLALLTGCLIIPVDYYDAGVRHNIDAKAQSDLQPGVTTKEEVLLKLGEPDFASDDGLRVGYAWTKVKALVIVASYGGGGEAEIKRGYLLEVSFDPDGRVSGTRLAKKWGDQVSLMKEEN